VLLTAFLCTFLFIRTSARLMRSPRVPWWPGSVTTDSGLHLHHLVWGIVLMMFSGFLSFVVKDVSFWTDVFAAVFGIGMGLTLDEFALWIYLRDVYWAEEGRSSLDAVVIALLIGGLIVLGLSPFDVHDNTSSVTTLAVAVGTDVVLAGIAALKGKPLLAITGIFVPFVSLAGAIRLASPRSPWARRFYAADSRRMQRSKARWARIEARRRRIGDLIAGTPSPELAADRAAPNLAVDRAAPELAVDRAAPELAVDGAAPELAVDRAAPASQPDD
jgi:hypothetical protein